MVVSIFLSDSMSIGCELGVWCWAVVMYYCVSLLTSPASLIPFKASTIFCHVGLGSFFTRCWKSFALRHSNLMLSCSISFIVSIGMLSCMSSSNHWSLMSLSLFMFEWGRDNSLRPTRCATCRCRQLVARQLVARHLVAAPARGATSRCAITHCYVNSLAN